MNLLCKMGLHDWEVVQAISGREISEGIFDLETTNLLCLSEDPERWMLFHAVHEDKICRRCGCTSEKIEPAIRAILIAGKAEKEEHDKAVWARHAARQRVRKIKQEMNNET